jgi:mannose-1-phosphate guanylyltransferase
MEIHKYVGTEAEQEVINAIYPNLRKTSIDYAIFEKTNKMAVLEADFGWSDVGSWSAVKDIQNLNNVLKGDVKLINSENCLVYGNDKFIAGINLKNLIIVDTEDAILICDKNSSQDVKKIVTYLQEEGREDLL